MTGSWLNRLPSMVTSVGISRGIPRARTRSQRFRELEPGSWFRSVNAAEYLVQYREILEKLDARAVHDELCAFGNTVALLCWEKPLDCHTGRTWCHRHIVAQWFEDTLGIEVPEFDHPNLDRFAYFRKHGIEVPRFRPSAATGSADAG